MGLLLFPLFMSGIAVIAVLWLILRHGAFLEGFRQNRAEVRAIETARNAQKSFYGYSRVTLIAVVRHDRTVLLGYKATDALSAAPKVTALELPGNGETMVAWVAPEQYSLTDTLDLWCQARTELYMKIDPSAKTVLFTNLELEDTIELALSPVRL